MNKPLIVARCGDVQTAPENTLSAFAGAIAKGVDTIELDVQATRDGSIIVHHDFYLGRTDNGRGYIGDYTFAELRALDAGSWFDTRFHDERIPTLREVLELGKGQVRFEIDLKGSSLSFLDRLVNEITRFGIWADVELTSAHVPLLFHVKRINPAARIGLFFYPLPDWMQPELGQQHITDWLISTDAQVAHLAFSLIEAEFVARLQAGNVLVHGSNLNTAEHMKKAIVSGIDQFSTDHVDLALAVRHEMAS